ERHRQVVERLLESGAAYKCSCTPDEIEAMRERARREGKAPRYDGTCRKKAPGEIPENMPFVVRFKTPDQGSTLIEDQVQGRITIANDPLDDLILLRSDGSPTYMLSVVVDDHDMGVTHVIRGDDHSTNAARQKLIYEALGWEVPVFAHIPLIHGADGAKLSKRHGALGVEAYRAMGYLPEALRNYLVRLGWSHGNDEVISTAQMIEWFGLEAVGKAPARFDFAKLENLNGIYIREMEDEALLGAFIDALPFLDNGPERLEALDGEMRARLLRAMPGLKARAKTLNDLVAASRFLFASRPLHIETKAAKALDDAARIHLAGLYQMLEEVEEWTPGNIESTVRAFASAKDLKFGKVAQPLRSALTGSSVSPGIFDVLYALGRSESLARIADQAQTS
ncbi:MAG TPA: glutamate--tRNA ligase, partial [Rhizobiales bacterium]|nr:glutamate--tRNA ligase [Hyphomicrobiales bacterium]